MRNTTPTPIRPHQTSLLSDQAHPPSSPSLHTHPYSTKPLKPHIHHQQHPTQPHHLSPTIPKQTKPIHTYRVDKTPYQPPSPPTHSLSSTSEIDASREPPPPVSDPGSSPSGCSPDPCRKRFLVENVKMAITTTPPFCCAEKLCSCCAEDLSIRYSARDIPN